MPTKIPMVPPVGKYPDRERVCRITHNHRPIHAFGLCKSCYNVVRYGKTNSERTCRLYHAKKIVHDLKWLLPKFNYAKRFKGVSKGNYKAFIKYKNMITQRLAKIANSGYTHLLDGQYATTYGRDGNSYDVELCDLLTLFGTKLTPTNTPTGDSTADSTS